uniref:CUB domain-containing protein n=1 Tax=Steinernema glaseri TaxID=37863 RepID=A0A1I7XY91_9BILA
MFFLFPGFQVRMKYQAEAGENQAYNTDSVHAISSYQGELLFDVVRTTADRGIVFGAVVGAYNDESVCPFASYIAQIVEENRPRIASSQWNFMSMDTFIPAVDCRWTFKSRQGFLLRINFPVLSIQEETLQLLADGTPIFTVVNGRIPPSQEFYTNGQFELVYRRAGRTSGDSRFMAIVSAFPVRSVSNHHPLNNGACGHLGALSIVLRMTSTLCVLYVLFLHV